MGLSSEVFAGDEVLFGAAGTLKREAGIVSEKLFGLVFPSAEGGEDSLDGATTAKLELAGFKGLGLFFIGDFRNIICGEIREPFFIKIRLGGDEDVGVIGEAEDPARALFRLIVKVLDPLDRVGGFYFDGGIVRRVAGGGGL